MNKRKSKILLSAERRHSLLQQRLFNKYRQPIVTINLNIPDIKKNKKIYRKFFKKAKADFFIFLKVYKFPYQCYKEKTNIAGSFLVVVLKSSINCCYLKKLLIESELRDPSTQLINIDVYNQNHRKISRTEINYPLKKCYLCSESAKICAQTRKHDLNLLLTYVNEVINQALINNKKWQRVLHK